jgi:NUMOD3 motif
MGISRPTYGKSFSEEHRRNLSLPLKGKVVSEETRNKLSETFARKRPPP